MDTKNTLRITIYGTHRVLSRVEFEPTALCAVETPRAPVQLNIILYLYINIVSIYKLQLQMLYLAIKLNCITVTRNKRELFVQT